MNYRRLGRAGMRVSEVSLGSWLTIGNVTEQETARACVRRAFDLGINFFDTADVYAKGAAETALGSLLAELPRKDLVVASKCFFPMSEAPNDRGLSRKHILESCDASLQRLGLDYLDLYQCHRYDPDVELEEVIAAMDHLVRQGKILYWGTSNWTALQLSESVHLANHRNQYAQVSDQPCYNVLHRDIEGEVRMAAARHGIGFVVYSPLAQGALSGKYSGGARAAGTRAADERVNQFMDRWLTPDNLARIDRLVEVAAEVGCTPAQLALRWCLRLPEVSSVIVGASRPEQIDDNAAASDVAIDAAVWQRLDEALNSAPCPS